VSVGASSPASVRPPARTRQRRRIIVAVGVGDGGRRSGPSERERRHFVVGILRASAGGHGRTPDTASVRPAPAPSPAGHDTAIRPTHTVLRSLLHAPALSTACRAGLAKQLRR